MHAPAPEKSPGVRARRSAPAVAAIAACVALSAAAADECPAPALASGTARPAAIPKSETELGDTPIEYEADGLEATRDGEWLLQGDVLIKQGERTLKTRNAKYNAESQSFSVDEQVEYSDPELAVSGTSAHVDQAGGATFEGAKFELKDRNARGAADRIQVTRENQLKLNGVRYTTCPVGEEDWVLRASDIDIRQRAGIGFGRGVRLDFKGVPIFYTPFLSFPVGNQRKSGFLFPVLGTSTRSGSSLSVPWYWNIAPNYDATFSPTYFTKRGAKLDSEWRYLTDFGRGMLETEYLPDDREFGDSRSYLHFVDRSDFTDTLRLDIDAANVGDSAWFEDFGLGPEGTSISYLDRSASLTYLTQHWLAVLRAAEFPDHRRRRHPAGAAAAHAAAAAGGARRVSQPARGTRARPRPGGRRLRAQLRRPRRNRVAHGRRAGDPAADARRGRLSRTGGELALHVLPARRPERDARG